MIWSYAFEGTRDAVKKAVAIEVDRLAGLERMTKEEIADVRASGVFVASHVDALKLDVSVAPNPDPKLSDPRKWNGCRVQASGTQADGMANLNVHIERKHFSL